MLQTCALGPPSPPFEKIKDDNNKTILWSSVIFCLLEIISSSTRLTVHIRSDPGGPIVCKTICSTSVQHQKHIWGPAAAAPGGSSVAYEGALRKPPCQHTLQYLSVTAARLQEQTLIHRAEQEDGQASTQPSSQFKKKPSDQ